MSEFELHDPPTDGISSLNFSTWDSRKLLATSWDSNAYLYDVSGNVCLARFSTGAALLDGCFSATRRDVAYVVGLGRQIHKLDLTTFQSETFGQHDDAIKSIVHCSKTGLIFTGSWDKTLKVWTEGGQLMQTISLPDKVYSMDLVQSKHLLLVSMAGRHIYLYDTRKLDHPIQKRESSLKYQTRCIRGFPDGEGFICTSIEGRVAVDFIDPSAEVQASRYAFKCHRHSATDQEGFEVVYPVNSVAYHPKVNCFFTGGSDGVVSSWDRIARKRIRQLPKYPTSIAAMALDADGVNLAIAASYCFEEGEKDHPPESIFIRKLEESDCKSKVTNQ